MRVSRLEFKGYRRLGDAATNIDGPLTAFVGFNEAGKTSMLNALTWFTVGGALAEVDYNRSRAPEADSSPVVKVFFSLTAKDKAAFADIPMDDPPTSFALYRKRDGGRVRELIPRPKRPAKPFAEARERLLKYTGTHEKQLIEATMDDDDNPAQWAVTAAKALLTPNVKWDDASLAALDELAGWLSETPVGLKNPRDAKLAQLLKATAELARLDHPDESAYQAIRLNEPKFALFGDDDRKLETSYPLDPAQRSEIHPAVNRLLLLAHLDPDELWGSIESGNTSKRENLLEKAKDRLEEVFDQAWNQSKVAVRFNVSGDRLEVLIKELHSEGVVTDISERSDGLKTFVALVAFLESGDYAVPPVLLIDEAETHLHYDAQADLVSVLLKSVDTTQVFYTTHSPGCLPSDLGTGIRVLARDIEHADSSIIKNNFWEGEGPGFSPLLFAMGAGAAAFSMCRNAVLAEGAADMVLLPSLIRRANEVDDLDYQIAPGLANAHGSGIRVEEVAAKVVYLTDGDAGGKSHILRLKEVGVQASRVFALPNACAVEDLIEPDDYVVVVNSFLNEMNQKKSFSLADVPDGTSISKAFADWAKSAKVQFPSKVEIAYALLREPNLRLTASGKKALKTLHAKFEMAFAANLPPK